MNVVSCLCSGGATKKKNIYIYCMYIRDSVWKLCISDICLVVLLFFCIFIADQKMCHLSKGKCSFTCIRSVSGLSLLNEWMDIFF